MEETEKTPTDGIQEAESRKAALEAILKSSEELKGKLDQIKKDVDLKSETATTVLIEINQKKDDAEKIKGEIDKIRNKADESTILSRDLLTKAATVEEKSTEVLNQIEGELKAGATSLNLAKSFADKVGEYHRGSRYWSIGFIVFTVAALAYYGVVTFHTDNIGTFDDVWRHLVYRLPLFVFSVWLAIFLGNRRAETKKLEESYKHKEVMARSFVGYKKTLEDLNEEDKTLLKQHMENLLKAVGVDSGEFLKSEGDKHPIFDLLASIFTPKKP
jgi:hypothetical protein